MSMRPLMPYMSQNNCMRSCVPLPKGQARSPGWHGPLTNGSLLALDMMTATCSYVSLCCFQVASLYARSPHSFQGLCALMLSLQTSTDVLLR